jgi:ABC-type transport system substrate-binding protein
VDWFGNNGRDVIVPMFDSRSFGRGGFNYGGYWNPDVDALMHRATTMLGAESVEQVSFDIAQRVMDEVAFVPLVQSKTANAVSRRVRGCTRTMDATSCDLTALWLADGASAPGRSR